MTDTPNPARPAGLDVLLDHVAANLPGEQPSTNPAAQNTTACNLCDVVKPTVYELQDHMLNVHPDQLAVQLLTTRYDLAGGEQEARQLVAELRELWRSENAPAATEEQPAPLSWQARANHAVELYARTAIERDDARAKVARLRTRLAAVERQTDDWTDDVRQALAFNENAQQSTTVTVRDVLLDTAHRTPEQALTAAGILLAAHTRDLAAAAHEYTTQREKEMRAAGNRSRTATCTGMRHIVRLLDQRAALLDPQPEDQPGTSAIENLDAGQGPKGLKNTTADRAAALGMTPTEYRTHRHHTAVEQIRTAAQGLLVETGARVLHALGTAPVVTEEPETAEQCTDREETERDHAAGNHQYCGLTCETEFPSDMLRNGILARAIPGSARILDELLRRASAPAVANTQTEPFRPCL
ncbi:hypothetical protein [Streptomyces sp. NPDC055036]